MTVAAPILLVEDNPADVELTLDVLGEARVANEVHVTRDGDEALAFLERRPPFAAAPTPGLVLLDLKLPKLSGPDVLAQVKRDPGLRAIPVVVLTTSRAPADRLRTQAADAYLYKPLDVAALARVTERLEGFELAITRNGTRPDGASGDA